MAANCRPIDVQRAYLRAARELNLAGSAWVVDEWESILDDLESDPLSTGDRLDWSAKKNLLDAFVVEEELDWTRDREFLQALDLEYHNVDAENGLYYGLVQSGAMQTLVSDDEIETARCAAPNTRACLRGLLVEKFAPQIKAISWGVVLLEDNGELLAVYLPEDSADCAQLHRSVSEVSSVREVLQLLPAAE